MKKLILSAAFAVFAVMAFAQSNADKKQKEDVAKLFKTDAKDISFTSDAMIFHPDYVAPKKSKRKDKNALQSGAITSSYTMADGSTMQWLLLYNKTTKQAEGVALDNSLTSSDQFVAQPLPTNFWEKAQQSLTKGDEANQKLSIEALLKQVYK